MQLLSKGSTQALHNPILQTSPGILCHTVFKPANVFSRMAQIQTTLILILLFVHFCTGQASPEVSAKCDVNSDSYSPDVPKTYYSVSCKHITKPEGVKLMKQTLDDLDFGLPITISLEMSSLDAISPEMFVSHNVTTLILQNNRMTKMPYNLICFETVRLVALMNNQLIPGLMLTPDGFRDCKKLQLIELKNTSLTVIPPGSFRGLESLIELRITFNHILLIPDLSGLENSLETLIIAFNPITFVPRNAFQNMKKLKNLNLMNSSIIAVEDGAFNVLGPESQAVLSGNPLHCDCSLEWLQQWYKKHPSNETEVYGVPYCSTPMVGPLMALNFCNKTTSPSGGTNHQPGWTPLIACIFVAILLESRNMRFP